MKYLKYFEGVNDLRPTEFDTECLEDIKFIRLKEGFNGLNMSQEELDRFLDEIKSAFIEYIDEFDIEPIPDDLDENDDSKPGLYYNLYWSWHDTRRKKIGFDLWRKKSRS